MIKLALSFDDGRCDQYRTFKEILTKFNIPATLFVTSGYVMDECSDAGKPSDNVSMTISNLKELSENPLFEISGHGREHNNELDNFITGVNDLKSVLNMDNRKYGIASPQCRLKKEDALKMQKDLSNNDINYIRIGDRFYHNAFIKKVIRRLNRAIKSSIAYNYVYKDSNINLNDNYILHSAIVTKYDTLRMMKKFIDYAVKTNKSYVLMLHSILKKDEDFYNDTYSWDYDDFISFCEYLKKLQNNGKIELIKVKDFIK